MLKDKNLEMGFLPKHKKHIK